MKKRLKNNNVCLISFSNNADHQNTLYSMFNALENKGDVFTIGIINPKVRIAPKTNKNFFTNCPKRPGVCKGFLNFKELFRIKKFIKKNNIKYLYFESQHLWNLFLMIICPCRKKIVVVHDVIPHDGNKSVILSNFVTCHLSNHIIIRNEKYINTLRKKYHLKKKKITKIDVWREYPSEKEPVYSNKFLCFGRIRKYKGLANFEKIVSKTPDVEYLLVGEPDEESKDDLSQIRKYKNVEIIAKEVTDNEMINIFNESDWIVLPYSSATQSGVIIDACRFSRPVIAFNVGAISEQIENKKSGFLVEDGNINQFVEIINKVKSLSKDSLKNFSHNAYLYGYNKYSAKAKSEEFYNIIKNI